MEAAASANAGRIQRSLSSSRPIRISDEDEQEFIEAVADYKRRSGRLFPTCSELLEVIRSLGYARRIWKPVGSWTDGSELESNVLAEDTFR